MAICLSNPYNFTTTWAVNDIQSKLAYVKDGFVEGKKGFISNEAFHLKRLFLAIDCF